MAVMTVDSAYHLQTRAICRNSLDACRFTDDIALLQAIRDDKELAQQLQRTEALRRHSRMRTRLLSSAVRVHEKLIPNVARSLEHVSTMLDTSKPLEAYVFDEHQVHAFVSENRNRYLVGLSSGAVNRLTAEELEFVIGHELGHAAFGHLEVAAGVVIELGAISREHCKLLRAWQRACEISADRIGLLCCDSLEVAATALFKTICGLDLPGVVIDPGEFAQQWHGLAEEIMEQGSREHWQLTHPFPPLRMKALELFWNGTNRDGGGLDQRTESTSDAVDREVGRLLAHMRSAGVEHGDPLLARFNFWGALYVALADGRLDSEMLGEFSAMAPPGFDADELLCSTNAADTPSVVRELCLRRFREARRTRREKLSAKELHGLIAGFVDVASRQGSLSERGVEHLTHLGRELGIATNAVHLLIDKRKQ